MPKIVTAAGDSEETMAIAMLYLCTHARASRCETVIGRIGGGSMFVQSGQWAWAAGWFRRHPPAGNVLADPIPRLIGCTKADLTTRSDSSRSLRPFLALSQ